MNIQCPQCNYNNDLTDVELSNHACDSVEVECQNDDCKELFNVGWYVTAELR